ncbi:HEAT repeat domain-containing protein [Actinoplanes sp. NPDC051411]|uniref:HEAT repeat domain-containing protein n=1 Tax=Actinoplanes sp. NPDC051411 TaxID=3155522 RepID=UPI00341E814A
MNFADALQQVGPLDDEALDRLGGMLGEVDEKDALGAVTALGRRVRLTARMDGRTRAQRWVSHESGPLRGHFVAASGAHSALVDRFAAGERGPIVLVVASWARYFGTRERAVNIMQAGFEIQYLPFLVLRTADWAEPVRDAARTIVSRRIGTPERLAAAVPMAVYVAGRDRGGWAIDTIRDRVRAEFDRFGPALLASRETYARRLGFEIAREQGRVDYAEQVRRAGHDGDTIIRGWAAGAARAEAVRRGDRKTLRSLARSRFAGVRVEALIGLVKLGHDDDLTAALDDGAALVRAYARSRTTDAAAHYRVTVTTAPSPGSIAGLGETGVYADAALLAPLLASADAPLRAAAIRALAALDSMPVDDVLPLLRDPAPAVVREAANALRFRRTPPELPWQLLADPRPEVRRAGYRLTAARPRHEQLRAALLLAHDADPALARSGLSAAHRLLHGLGDNWWSRRRFPIPPDTHPELIDLATRLGEPGARLAAGIRATPPE